MAIVAGAIEGYLDLDIEKFKNALSEASDKLDSASSKMEESVGKGTSGIESKWDQATSKISAGGNTIQGVGAKMSLSLSAGILSVGAASVTQADQVNKASSTIQASLGLASDETERLTDVARQVYTNGFGESLDQVANDIIMVRQQLGDLNDTDLNYVTTGVQNLSDLFDADVKESVRGVKVLMDNFGLSAQEAMDLFASGCQNGLNVSDELGDNLSEYGPRFSQMGFSAEEYFQILQNGVNNGAYSLDKCNDFLNEFQTALSDGRMDENIGSFSQSTQELFQKWKDGSATGKEVYESVISDLGGMSDKYQQAQVASAIWSSLGEDNAMSMITAMSSVGDTYDDVSGKSGEMADQASQSLGTQFTSTIRSVQDCLADLGSTGTGPLTDILNLVQQGVDWFKSLDDGTKQMIVTIALVVAAIGPVVSIVGTLMTVLGPIVSVIGTIVAAVGGIPVVIAVVVAAIVGLLATNEDFRNAVIGIWNAICEGAQQIFQAIADFLSVVWQGICDTAIGLWNGLTSTLSGIWQGIQDTVSSIWNGIKDVISTVWNTIVSVVTGSITNVQNIISSILNTIKSIFSSAWNACKTTVTNAFNGIKNGVSNGIQSVLNFVRNLPGQIKSALGNLGNLLLGAGKSIINGLLRGLRSAFGNVKSFVGGIGSWIQAHKGPEEYDRKLLIPNGGWIIEGLGKGLEKEFEQVLDQVDDYGQRISDEVGSKISMEPIDLAASMPSTESIDKLSSTAKLMSQVSDMQKSLGIGNEFSSNYSNTSTFDYTRFGQEVVNAMKDSPIVCKTDIHMEDGDVYMDGEKVGRKVAPTVSRVQAKEASKDDK